FSKYKPRSSGSGFSFLDRIKALTTGQPPFGILTPRPIVPFDYLDRNADSVPLYLLRKDEVCSKSCPIHASKNHPLQSHCRPARLLLVHKAKQKRLGLSSDIDDLLARQNLVYVLKLRTVDWFAAYP